MAAIQNQLPEFGIGDRLRKAREFRGFTGAQMADLLTERGRKTSSSSVSAWEREAAQPQHLVDLIGLYALVTDLPESWFWTGHTDTPGLSDDLLLAGQMTLPLALNRAA